MEKTVIESDVQPFYFTWCHEKAAGRYDAVGYKEEGLHFGCDGVDGRIFQKSESRCRDNVPVIKIDHGTVYPFRAASRKMQQRSAGIGKLAVISVDLGMRGRDKMRCRVVDDAVLQSQLVAGNIARIDADSP